MTYRIRTLIIAVVLAALAAALTGLYVTSYKHKVDNRQELVPIVVATGDIPSGTTGQAIASHHLVRISQLARSSVVPGAISSPDAIAKLVALQPTYAGEQLSARRFGPVTVEGVRSQLSGAYRAVQVAGTSNQILAGVLKAGDHVDVVANVKFPSEDSQKHFTKVVLRNLLVLRTSGAPSGTAKVTNPTNGGGWVMLRVTDSQSQRLFFATTNADWTLELRPGLNDSDSPSTVADAASVLRAGLRGVDAAALAAAKAAKR